MAEAAGVGTAAACTAVGMCNACSLIGGTVGSWVRAGADGAAAGGEASGSVLAAARTPCLEAFAGLSDGEPAGSMGRIRVRLCRCDIVTLELVAGCGRGSGGGGLFVFAIILGSFGRSAG